MPCSLGEFLTEDETSQISVDVKTKIENELTQRESSLDSVKAELDKVRSDYEQKCYEMDKSMIDLSAKLDIETNNCSRATEKCKDLETKLSCMKIKTDSLEESYAETQGEIAALKHSGSIWKDEKLSMQHLLETRDLEMKQLKEERKVLSDKLTAAVTARNELDLKLDELQNSGVTVQYHNKRLEQERELLSQQNNRLSDELTAKANELNSTKLSSNNDIVSLRSRLELKMDECNQLGDVNKNLRESNSSLEKKVSQLLEKLNTADEERQSMEELYRNELQSMTNLSELYKDSAKDEESKAKELQSAVRELQKLANDSANARKDAENLVSEWEKKAQSMNTEIEMQKKELEKANDLLLAQRKQGPQNLSDEELAALCPTAAMASKFIKSGMTLTEIYTKYIETLDDLEVSKHENKRMSDIMDEILQELQEKAPILKQQKEDYERALATVTQLTSQLDAAAIDCQRLKAETDDATRKLGKVEREKRRLESETRDLSKQVKYLLKEVEENRGQFVTMDRGADADPNVSSSSEVISEHLVTFKSIGELQEQNRRLLRVVRELGDDNEKRENETRTDEIQRLNQTLDEAKEELEHLREERTKQIDYVEAIVRQRDMFRVLLSQEPKGSIPLSIIQSPVNRTSTKGAGDTDRSSNAAYSDNDSSQALQVLKQEFDEYKKDSQDNSKVMCEQTDVLRSQISNLRADNAKLKANVDFSNEKYDLLKVTFENMRKESDMVREKNTKLLVMVQKHELNYNKISNDLIIAQQEKTALQTKIENLRSEIDILRRAEEHVRSENSSLKRDQQGQSVLLVNLQKIQQSMERQDLEVRSELRSRIDSLTRELEALRKSGNDALKQKQAALQMAQKQFMNSQQALSSVRTDKDTVKSELQKKKSELEEMTVQNQSYVSKISVLEQRLSRTSNNLPGDAPADDATEQSLKECKEQIKSLQSESNTLKLKYEREQRSAQQHKECAAAVEESLKQANEANRELSDAMDARLKAASEHQIKLEQRITVLEDENRQLNSKKTSLISEVDQRTSDLNRQLTLLQDELNMVLQREKELRRSEQEARRQYQEQAHLIAEAQNKYQREMVIHAESVKELMDLKASYKKTDENLENLKLEANQAKHLLDSNKGMWEKQKAMLVKENEELMERSKDLNGQISALHGELENMSHQLVDLQQKKASETPVRYRALQDVGAATPANDPTGKSQEQMMDIIRYLRKEKNLHEVKYEVTQTENNRLKQQITHLQNNVNVAKKSLHDQQQKSQATSSELAKHKALMQKVETLNVLTDSNRMLRDENTRLQEELQNTKTSLSDVKGKLAPLQCTNTQLSSQKEALETEKKALEQDVQRWQQRSQQLLQSPKRQDPEEYRKLLGEKQQLSRNNDQLNKDLTEKKLEISNLQGEIRNLNQQTETLKSESTNTLKRIETLENEAKAKQAEVEEKSKTIAQIRRVGRRYKMQFEELQAKIQAMESKEQATADEKQSDSSQEQAAALQATNTELNAKVSALETALTRANKEKDDTQAQLVSITSENDSLKTQVELANKKCNEENKASSNNAAQEIQKLMTERDEMKKQLQEKDDKSKRLLTLAKTRIEQFRRDKDELATERNQLKEEEQKLKESVENLKQTVKKESDQKMELATKVDELQKQISASNLQQQQQNKVNTVVGHQSHAGSSNNELRKAVNIRPISTQRVSQVSPMRVTRTARVMPEPQQDAQEGSSSDVTSARSAAQHPSSLSTVGTGVGSSVTRAFVHPMTLSSGRQPPVVSSTPTTGSPPTSGSSDPSQAEALVARGTTTHTSSSTDATQAASSSATSGQPTDGTENDQAIVSSSDDQTSQPDESQATSAPPSTAKALSTIRESEDVPSQSASSSGDSSVTASSISVLIGRQSVSAQKRPYDDVAETNTASDEIPASSSDAQVDVPPVSKRLRGAPDQSSAAGPSSDISTAKSTEPSQVSEAGSSSSVSVSNLQAADTQGILRRQEDAVGTSSAAAIAEHIVMGSDPQSVPTSSGAVDVIVLSSDDDGSQPGFSNVEQDSEMYNAGEEEETLVPEVSETEQAPQQHHYIPSRPVLEPLNPTPPDVVRIRTMIRPAPLTPGLVPPAADDGDGIVPCTPTLPTGRHDDYQAINSPHVPANNVPIRFRFEDVSSQSLQPQSGILSVDNTIMDFTDAARSVPTTPNPIASVTTVTHVLLDQQQPSGQQDTAAVTSSIMEEGELEEEDETASDMAVPPAVVPSDEPTASSNTQPESQGTFSYLQSKRGRRIKLIGGRSRGKDGSSPSTSNQ